MCRTVIILAGLAGLVSPLPCGLRRTMGIYFTKQRKTSNPVLYLSHTLNTSLRVVVVPLLSVPAKRGRNVRNRFEMRILPSSKSQKEEPRGPVVGAKSVILHYRISETFEVYSPFRTSHTDGKEDSMIFETMTEALGIART
jgi:hypothetical protein